MSAMQIQMKEKFVKKMPRVRTKDTCLCTPHKNKIIENVREKRKILLEILAVVRYDYLNEETYFMEVMS